MDQSQSTQLVTYDPIQILPYDVWVECIKFAMVNDSASPLPYLAVSSEWSMNLMEEASLWTTIIVERGEDVDARIHTLLYLSRSFPLDVVYTRGGSIDTLLAILEANAPRIRTIEGSGYFGYALFETGYSFPSLQACSGLDYIPGSFLLRCPNLTSISTSISTPFNGPSYVNIEDHHLLNPAIQKVLFCKVTPDNFYRISPPMKYRQLGINVDGGSFSYFADYTDLSTWSNMMHHLSTHFGSYLEHLSMAMSLQLLPALLLHVPLLRQLHTLNLRIFFPDQEELYEDVFVEGIQQIRNLHLDFCYTGTGEEKLKVFDIILRAFEKAKFFQSIEELFISAQGAKFSDIQLGSCLQSATNARKITIGADWYDETPETLIPQSSPMTKLESLTVNSLPILYYISTARPISLRLIPGAKGRILPKRKLELQAIGCEDHGMLNSLDPINQEELLRGCYTIIFRGYFKLHLSMKFNELAVVDFLGIWREQQRVTNDFLCGILRSPQICPRLHTIKMETYTFW